MTTKTEGKRQFVPTVGNTVKLRLWSDYTSRNIHVWAHCKVLAIYTEPYRTLSGTVDLQVMNGMQETDQIVNVPLAAIQPPIGWQPAYTIYCKPEETDKVMGWFPRGIRVKVDHAMDRLAGNAYMPADVDGAPTWGYYDADVIPPDECPKVFSIVAYVHEEFRMPKDAWERKQYRKSAKLAGWTIESRNYGAHGYAWFRSKEVTVYDAADGFHTPAPDYMFKAPQTSLDLLARLDAESRPYDADSERKAIQAGQPIGRWILNRAEYHLNGTVQSAGNSTWMFDPKSTGDPVNRK